MDVEKLKRSVEGRGWSFKHFATGEEAANYAKLKKKKMLNWQNKS